MDDGIRVVLVTFPDMEAAERIAGDAVSNGVVACANIVPEVRSIYRWKGTVERASEALVVFKTRADRVADLVEVVVGSHPHEVPEVVTLPVDEGYEPYLRWVADEASPGGATSGNS